MGNERLCLSQIDGKSGAVKVRLETDTIIVRGELQARIPLKEITKAVASDARLQIEWGTRKAFFLLGTDAERWAEKIKNPKSVMDKLGVKPGMVVSVIGVRDAGFLKRLSEVRSQNAEIRSQNPCDLVFFGVEKRGDLKELASLKRAMKPNGALWVIRPKGSADISEAEVMAAGKAAGLVDVKVVRLSETHTAEKLVIPVSSRKRQ